MADLRWVGTWGCPQPRGSPPRGVRGSSHPVGPGGRPARGGGAGRGRRLGAARLGPAPPRCGQAELWVPHGGVESREAALPSGQGTAPTCGAPAFSRRCLGRLASSLGEPGRGQARTGGARRKRACDSSLLRHVTSVEQPSSTDGLWGRGLRTGW